MSCLLVDSLMGEDRVFTTTRSASLSNIGFDYELIKFSKSIFGIYLYMSNMNNNIKEASVHVKTVEKKQNLFEL